VGAVEGPRFGGAQLCKQQHDQRLAPVAPHHQQVAVFEPVVELAEAGKQYGYIPSWYDQQIITNREEASTFPEPNKKSRLTRGPRVADTCGTPLERASGEGKGTEGNRKGTRRWRLLPQSRRRWVENCLWDFGRLTPSVRAPTPETRRQEIHRPAEIRRFRRRHHRERQGLRHRAATRRQDRHTLRRPGGDVAQPTAMERLRPGARGRAPDGHAQPIGILLDVGDVEGDQLRAAKSPCKARRSRARSRRAGRPPSGRGTMAMM
jgi:hypothetical protein